MMVRLNLRNPLVSNLEFTHLRISLKPYNDTVLTVSNNNCFRHLKHLALIKSN
jgi:hypothetical protein